LISVWTAISWKQPPRRQTSSYKISGGRKLSRLGGELIGHRVSARDTSSLLSDRVASAALAG
jgi:hypothetical protein